MLVHHNNIIMTLNVILSTLYLKLLFIMNYYVLYSYFSPAVSVGTLVWDVQAHLSAAVSSL